MQNENVTKIYTQSQLNVRRPQLSGIKNIITYPSAVW